MASNSPPRNPRIPVFETASTLSMSPDFSPLPFESPHILSSSILSKQTSQFDLSPVLYSSRAILNPTFRLQEKIAGALSSRETVEDPLERVRRALVVNHRSREDARILYEFLENTKFFRDFRENNALKLFENDALKYICQHMRYERAVAGKVVSEKGNTEGKTYIILSGEVCRVNNKESAVMNIKQMLKRSNSRKFSFKMSDQTEEIDIRKKSMTKEMSFENSSFQGKSVIGRDSILQKTMTSQDYSMETSTKLPGLSFERSMIRDKTPEPVNFYLKQHTQGRISPEKSESILKGQMKIVKMAQPTITQQVKNPVLGTRASIIIKPCDTSEIAQNSTPSEGFKRRSERFGTVLSKLYKEDYFGGLGSDSSVQQDTLVVGSECELLIIDEKVFAHIRKRFERKNAKKMNFFMDFFPGVELFANKNYIYNKLTELKEISFDVNSYITVQGTPSTACYMLFEGTCDLYMKLPESQAYNELINDYGEQRDHNKQDGLLVCKLSKGMFIGEEFFFNDDKQYEFTVKATSPDVSVIVIETSGLSTEVSREFFEALKLMYLNKRQNHFANALKRLKVKTAVVSLMNLSPKKSKNSARGESQEKEDRSLSPEFYKASSRNLSKEPSPSKNDTSTKVTNRVVQPIHRLPSPIAPTLKLKLECAAKTRARQKVFERRESHNTNKEEQDIFYSFRFIAQENSRSSPRLKRAVEKSEAHINNLTKEKEKKNEKEKEKEKEKSVSVEKVAIPKLNLEKLDDIKTKQKSIKQLLRRMKKSQSRAIRLNRDNISISIATDRSSSRATIVLPDDNTTKSINSDRGAKLNVFFADRKDKIKLIQQQTSLGTDTTKATLTLTERSIFNSMVERITSNTSGSSGKMRKDFVIHQKSKTLVDEQESYGLKPFWPQVTESEFVMIKK